MRPHITLVNPSLATSRELTRVTPWRWCTASPGGGKHIQSAPVDCGACIGLTLYPPTGRAIPIGVAYLVRLSCVWCLLWQKEVSQVNLKIVRSYLCNLDIRDTQRDFVIGIGIRIFSRLIQNPDFRFRFSFFTLLHSRTVCIHPHRDLNDSPTTPTRLELPLWYSTRTLIPVCTSSPSAVTALSPAVRYIATDSPATISSADSRKERRRASCSLSRLAPLQ
jgi:hypothetical protein